MGTVKKKTTKKKTNKTSKKVVKKTGISIQIKDSPKNKSKKKTKKKATKKTPQPHSKWREEYLQIIKNLFKAGRTIPDICICFGISESTYHNWRTLFFTDEVLESIGDWKAEADEKVELALFRKASGYIKIKNKVVKEGRKWVDVKEAVHVEGDVRAQQYWLNNRKKKDWSDNNEKDFEDENRNRSFGFTFDEEVEPLE